MTHVTWVGCPRENFMAIKSGTLTEIFYSEKIFLHTDRYAWLGQHIKSLGPKTEADSHIPSKKFLYKVIGLSCGHPNLADTLHMSYVWNNHQTWIRQPQQDQRVIYDNCTQANDRMYCRSINADEMLKRIDAEVMKNIKEIVNMLLRLEENSLLKWLQYNIFYFFIVMWLWSRESEIMW